jgi:hypothetical protein
MLPPFASPDGGCSRPHHEDDHDLREPLLDGPTSDGRISRATVGCEKEEEQGEEEEKDEESWPDVVLTWLVLPCVVWLDFWLVVVRSSGTSSSSSSSSNSPTCASGVTSVHVDFVLFLVASLLYRSTLGKGRGRPGSMILRLLLPGRDAAMVTMLLLTVGHRTCAAYQVLLWSTVALALAVVFGAYCYGSRRRDDDDDDDDDENDKATVDGGTGESGIFFGTEEQEVEGDGEKVAWSVSVKRALPAVIDL